MGRLYIRLEEWYVIHITILQLYKELIVLLIVLIFVLFGEEYAHISIPFQIVFADQIFLVAKIIQIMLLLHQMMRYKESLLFLFAGSTLQRMIMEFMISSASPSSRSSSVSSLKWRWRYVEDISNFVPCPILREDFPHVVFPLYSLFLT